MPQVSKTAVFYETIHTFLSEIKPEVLPMSIGASALSLYISTIQTVISLYWLLSFSSTLLFKAISSGVLPWFNGLLGPYPWASILVPSMPLATR